MSGCEVDLGMGLGDLMAVGLADESDSFDDLFAPNPNTTDFFKFSALDEAQQEQQEGPALTAPRSAESSCGSTGGFGLGELDFGQDGWNNRGAYEGRTVAAAKSELTTEPMMFPGKPRGRKRHDDEDEALEATEHAFPTIKRRSSVPSLVKAEDFSPTGFLANADAGAGASNGNLSERSRSFDRQAAAAMGIEMKPSPASLMRTDSGLSAASSSSQQCARMAPAGGAIKVKRDLMSVQTRPRISVFMSSSMRRSVSKKSPSASASLDGSPRYGAHRSRVLNPALPGNHGLSAEPNATLSPSLSSQRIKDLRIVVRPRSEAEQHVVESNPPVVAMGSRYSSAASEGGGYGVPRLHRASSVGALKIKGSGDVFSRSPVLSETGSIIQSCELSEQVGEGRQRRNLVCKVFGSGSPFSRPSAGPH